MTTRARLPRVPRPQSNTVAVAYLGALMDYARPHGLDLFAIGASLGIDLNDRDARVPEPLGAALFDHVATLLQDDALGLHVGEQIRPGHYGVLGYVAMNCATLGDALNALQRYQALVIDVGGLAATDHAGQMTLSWRLDPGQPLRQLAEFNLAGLVSFIRWMAGPETAPTRVDFIYPAPDDLREHRRILACPMRFDQSEYRLTMPLERLSAPLAQPDPAMRALMVQQAERQLRALQPCVAQPLAQIRRLIAQRLEQAPVELDWMAAQLSTSSRSLQRSLAADGLSLTQIVDEVRRELALVYLKDTELNLTDVAFLLGYSEQSALQRAFKRWTGQTPRQWRQSLTAA